MKPKSPLRKPSLSEDARPEGSLTTADLVALSLLAEKPMHGYDLLAEYQRQEVVDWASISKAQLYYALQKLAQRGLLEPVASDSGMRQRTVFMPTKAGRAALELGLADAAWASGRVPQPFTTWVGLSIHAKPSAVKKMLRARVEYLDREIDKEQSSLAYIQTLSAARARKGQRIVELVLIQLRVEKDWVLSMLDA